jgi:hypothetical protein
MVELLHQVKVMMVVDLVVLVDPNMRQAVAAVKVRQVQMVQILRLVLAVLAVVQQVTMVLLQERLQ